MQVIIVNVYAPCDLRGKRLLWDELKLHMGNRGGDRWCILGDFNSIKSRGERKGVVIVEVMRYSPLGTLLLRLNS